MTLITIKYFNRLTALVFINLNLSLACSYINVTYYILPRLPPLPEDLPGHAARLHVRDLVGGHLPFFMPSQIQAGLLVHHANMLLYIVLKMLTC